MFGSTTPPKLDRRRMHPIDESVTDYEALQKVPITLRGYYVRENVNLARNLLCCTKAHPIWLKMILLSTEWGGYLINDEEVRPYIFEGLFNRRSFLSYFGDLMYRKLFSNVDPSSLTNEQGLYACTMCKEFLPNVTDRGTVERFVKIAQVDDVEMLAQRIPQHFVDDNESLFRLLRERPDYCEPLYGRVQKSQIKHIMSVLPQHHKAATFLTGKLIDGGLTKQQLMWWWKRYPDSVREAVRLRPGRIEWFAANGKTYRKSNGKRKRIKIHKRYRKECWEVMVDSASIRAETIEYWPELYKKDLPFLTECMRRLERCANREKCPYWSRAVGKVAQLMWKMSSSKETMTVLLPSLREAAPVLVEYRDMKEILHDMISSFLHSHDMVIPIVRAAPFVLSKFSRDLFPMFHKTVVMEALQVDPSLYVHLSSNAADESCKWLHRWGVERGMDMRSVFSTWNFMKFRVFHFKNHYPLLLDVFYPTLKDCLPTIPEELIRLMLSYLAPSEGFPNIQKGRHVAVWTQCAWKNGTAQRAWKSGTVLSSMPFPGSYMVQIGEQKKQVADYDMYAYSSTGS